MKKVKKLATSFILSLLLVSVSFSSIFAPVAKAQWYAPDFAEFAEVVFDEDNEDEIFGERYTYAQVVWIVHSITAIIFPDWLLICWAARDDIGQWGQCIASIGDALTLNEPVPAGDTFAQKFDSMMSRNPISGYGYIKQKLAKFHIIPEAQAQTGFGFRSLQPIQPMWAAVRNISYFFLIIVFIAMSFMIMFKVKMSPQTVITVQSALPKLVVILVLITFSYAIAGLVIDLSYVVLGMFSVIVKNVGSDISGLGSSIDVFAVLSSTRAFSGIIAALLIYALILGTALGAVTTPIPFIGALGLLGGVLLMLVLLILFAIAYFKVLWLMVKTLINIILLIIAAPILILLGAFPGSGGVGGWLKKLVSHVAIFPTIQIMLFLANYFFWGFGSNMGNDLLNTLLGSWVNPFLIQVRFSDPIWVPGFSIGSGVAGFLIGIGILLLIPKIGDMIQSFIAGRPFALGTGMKETMGPGIWLGGTGGRVVAGRGAEYFGETATVKKGKKVGWRAHVGGLLEQASGRRRS